MLEISGARDLLVHILYATDFEVELFAYSVASTMPSQREPQRDPDRFAAQLCQIDRKDGQQDCRFLFSLV